MQEAIAVLCVLYVERLNKTLNIAIFQQLIFAMAELGEGADCSLQFRRLCLKGYRVCSFTSVYFDPFGV